MKIEQKSIITCPECGHKEEEEMSSGDCQSFYICENCLAILKPKSSDCCVFGSYGTAPCSAVQEYNKCG